MLLNILFLQSVVCSLLHRLHSVIKRTVTGPAAAAACKALYLWKRCPQGSLRAVDMVSQQMAQSSSLAASSSAVATANLPRWRSE